MQRSGAAFQPHRFRCLFFGKLVLIDHAQGALEIFGDVLPFGAGGNAALGVAQFFVIFPAANIADVFHKRFLLDF